MPESKEKISGVSEVPQNLKETQTGMVDLRPEKIGKEPIPREIKTWMEKVEQASSSQPQSVNDDTGQPLLIPSTPQNPKITLPITRSSFISGFKKPFEEASHWLSVFLFRFIKIKKGNIIFKSNDTN